MKPLWLFMLGLVLSGNRVAQAQFTASVYNGTAIITGYSGPGGAVVIPNMYGDFPVTGITFSTFYSNTTVTSVTIPYTLTNLNQQNVFVYCRQLTAIMVDSNNSSLSSVDGVLFDKYQTTLFTFPAGNGVKSYAVPVSVKNIANDAFSACYALTNLTVSEGLTNIDQGAFSDSALTSISLPDSLTFISTLAFSGCAGLTNVTLGNAVTSIGDFAFVGTSLAGVTIPNSVMYIGASTFASLSLTNVILPNSLVFLADFAFLDCSNLLYVTIPDAVTNIGYCPFGGCTNMEAIGVGSGNSAFSSVDGVVMDHNQTEVVEYPAGRAGFYAISNGTTLIGTFAFANCPYLTGVFIPNSVTNITNSAFYACTSLANVTIPGSVISIGDAAFASCSNLTSVTISNGVTFLADAVFANTGLKNATIPDSVTNMGVTEFEYCPSLANVVIGSNITSIQFQSFQYSGLTNITLPKNVTSIGDMAFYFCLNLASITIPSQVTNIGSEAFSFTGLTSVTIPNSVTLIEESAFEGAPLTNVILGSGVTNISDNAFTLCDDLAGLYFLGDAPSVGATIFQDDVRPIAYYLAGTTGWGTNFAGIPTVELFPWLESASLSGANLVLNLSNAASGVPYCVPTTTNLALPLRQWTRLSTNTANPGANFTLTLTNAASPADEQRFYAVQVQ